MVRHLKTFPVAGTCLAFSDSTLSYAFRNTLIPLFPPLFQTYMGCSFGPPPTEEGVSPPFFIPFSQTSQAFPLPPFPFRYNFIFFPSWIQKPQTVFLQAPFFVLRDRWRLCPPFSFFPLALLHPPSSFAPEHET